jgi:hypothetical protein
VTFNTTEDMALLSVATVLTVTLPLGKLTSGGTISALVMVGAVVSTVLPPPPPHPINRHDSNRAVIKNIVFASLICLLHSNSINYIIAHKNVF